MPKTSTKLIDSNGSWADLHRHRANIGCNIKIPRKNHIYHIYYDR